jgi:hypothetical protein
MHGGVMTVEQLISMAQARIAYLSQLRQSALSIGDIAQASVVDAELLTTQATLNQLLTLV